MSNYVFTDKKKKTILYANDCDSSNLNIEYFCPTPNCKAKLTLRSLNGERSPYFAALPSKTHDDFCIIPKLGRNKSDYNTSNFSMESLYDIIISKQSSDLNSESGKCISNNNNNNNESDKINTTSKLYYFCKGHDIEYIIKDQLKVINLIADDRTNFLFTKGIFGLKLVEAVFSRYERDNNKIYFNYPVNPLLKNKFNLCVEFNQKSDFEKILKKIFKNKDEFKNAHIAILANWEKDKCTIVSYRQIIVIGG